jgi:hypothetical protein
MRVRTTAQKANKYAGDDKGEYPEPDSGDDLSRYESWGLI